jgi:hypothetical protein
MTDCKIIIPGRRIASRIVDGQALILDPGTDALQRLNEVGSFIWARISERCHTEADIQAALIAEFAVETDQATQDLDVFLKKLVKEDLIAYRSD